jgi:HAD superfamily hydrolase (TIGR01549 family)
MSDEGKCMTRIDADRAIALVTFDLYDTLVEAVPPRWVRFAEAARQAGLDLSVDQFKLADRSAEDYYTIQNGWLPIRDRAPDEVEAFRLAYTATMLEAAGASPTEEQVRRVRDIYRGELDASGWSYRVFDDVMPALELLEANGVARAVISNADADVTDFCLHHGFAKHMDLIVTSALVGWEKPDPRTYHAALDPLGIEPAAAIHVGDQALSDVVGARGVGMGAALIDRYGRHGADEHDDAILVRSLVELAELVLAHNRQFAVR